NAIFPHLADPAAREAVEPGYADAAVKNTEFDADELRMPRAADAASTARGRNLLLDQIARNAAEGGAPGDAEDLMGPPISARDRVRGIVDRAYHVRYSDTLTQEQLSDALRDVRAGFRYAESVEEQGWLSRAALGLHTAGAERELMTPGESINTPEFLYNL